MNEVNVLSTSRLQNQEHFAFMTDLNNLAKEANVEELAPISARVAILLAEEDAALKIIAKSEHTAKLVKLDAECDNRYRGLVRRVESETYSPVPQNAEAANLLKIVIDTYKYFITDNYEKQCATAFNFIQELRTEKHKPAADLIGVTQWVNWLEADTKNLYDLYITRRDEYAAAMGKTRPVRIVRKELDELYREMSKHINALAILKPSEALSSMINKLNVSIEKWSTTVAIRQGRAKGS